MKYFVEQQTDDDEGVRCIYCDRIVWTADPAGVDDDDAWFELSKEHAPDCEWVTTRAHRLPEPFTA